MSKTKSEKTDTFEKGDVVKARWSGSNIFYDAKVVGVTSRTYKVQFDDGSVSSVKYGDVKKPSKSEKEASPKTVKPRSRSSSGGRKTRSRSRSPARGEKKATTKKVTPKESKKRTPSSTNSNSVAKDEVDTVSRQAKATGSPSPKRESSGNSVGEVLRRSIVEKKSSVVVQRIDDSTERVRTSTRLAALRASAERASVEKQNAKNKSVYSDDEEEEEKKTHTTASVSRSWKILHFIVTFSKMILLTASLLFLVFSCTKKQCTILDVPQFYSRLRDFGNAVKFPLLSVFAFHLYQCLFSLIPIGKKVSGMASAQSKSVQQYYMNGIFSLIFCLITFAACTYCGLYMNWGYDKYRGFALSSVIHCIVCALVLHLYAVLKGDISYHNKVPVLGNFYSGCYVNPVFKKIDLKTSLVRSGLIGSVLLSLSILTKFYFMKGYVTVPMVLTSGMHFFFVLDTFIREEKMLTTAIYTSDTIGYAFIITHGFMVPIGLSLQVFYLFLQDSKVLIPHWCSAAIVALFFLGYYIYLTSSNLKHNFRRNPFSLTMSDVVSIPTSQKKRLIASGWWGRIRHPNYFGLLIMAIAWSLPCGFSHVLPYGQLTLLVLAMLFRCFRIESECKEKYGPAWDNYTSKVRSRLLPYIF